jgi:hypothetical protein
MSCVAGTYTQSTTDPHVPIYQGIEFEVRIQKHSIGDMKKTLPSAFIVALALPASASITFEPPGRLPKNDQYNLRRTCFDRLSIYAWRLAICCQKRDTSSGSVAEVLRKHTEELMAIEGVVMVGQGKDKIGRDCIIVGVKAAQYLDKIPKMIEGVPVHATVIGEVEPL